MNDSSVAREIVGVARALAGADDTFTVRKPIRFKPEAGTKNSLENAQMIADAGYQFARATYDYDKTKADWKLTAFFERDGEIASHIFKGFSVGYGGEGSRGMMSFAQIFGIRLDPKKVLGEEGIPDKGLVDLERAFG
jgi:hypothetical protein